MFHEVRITREIVVLTMLEDEDAVFFQQSPFEDEAGYRGQFLQGLGRVGKDEVKLLFARFDVSEHIASERYHSPVPL